MEQNEDEGNGEDKNGWGLSYWRMFLLGISAFVLYYGVNYYKKYYYFIEEMRELGSIRIVSNKIERDKFIQLMKIIHKHSHKQFQKISKSLAEKRRKSLKNRDEDNYRYWIRTMVHDKEKLEVDYIKMCCTIFGMQMKLMQNTIEEYKYNKDFTDTLVVIELGIEDEDIELPLTNSKIKEIVNFISNYLNRFEATFNEYLILFTPNNKESIDFLTKYYKSIDKACKKYKISEEELEKCIKNYCGSAILNGFGYLDLVFRDLFKAIGF